MTITVYAITCRATRRHIVAATADLDAIRRTWHTTLLPSDVRRDLDRHGLSGFVVRELGTRATMSAAVALVEGLAKTVDPRRLYWPRPTSDDTAPLVEPAVYLLIAPHSDEATKVGITGDVTARLRQYQTSSPERDFAFYRTWDVPSMDDARAVEKGVLEVARAAGWVVRGEWICRPASLLASVVDGEVARRLRSEAA